MTFPAEQATIHQYEICIHNDNNKQTFW